LFARANASVSAVNIPGAKLLVPLPPGPRPNASAIARRRNPASVSLGAAGAAAGARGAGAGRGLVRAAQTGAARAAAAAGSAGNASTGVAAAAAAAEAKEAAPPWVGSMSSSTIETFPSPVSACCGPEPGLGGGCPGPVWPGADAGRPRPREGSGGWSSALEKRLDASWEARARACAGQDQYVNICICVYI